MTAVSTDLLLWILTAVAVLVVLGTRKRVLSENSGTSGGLVLAVHTVAGLLAAVLWTVLLFVGADVPGGDALVGIIGLALWWITGMAGVLIALRWLPAPGHTAEDRLTWPERLRGPWLTALAHLVMIAI